jgi:hypothetical protein
VRGGAAVPLRRIALAAALLVALLPATTSPSRPIARTIAAVAANQSFN